MTADETAIRARRKLTNRLIAGRDAERLRPFLIPTMTLIAGDGTVILGAPAVIEAFADQFRDPAFIAYVRATDSVALDQDGTRAAEAGRWTGTWRDAPPLSGPYLAAWRKVTGQWLLEAELYVSLG